MPNTWSIAQLETMQKQGKIRGFVLPNSKGVEFDTVEKSKYGNKKIELDGLLFASKKEADYYAKLRIMRKAGLIGQIECQVPYELNPGGTHSLKYIADFRFIDAVTGETKVIDVKGFRTVVYKKKRRLMKKIHSIEIIEV